MKTWHHFHFGLLHMQCVPGGPRVDAPSYAPRACDDGRRAENNQHFCLFPRNFSYLPSYRIAVAAIHGCNNQDTVHLHCLHPKCPTNALALLDGYA